MVVAAAVIDRRPVSEVIDQYVEVTRRVVTSAMVDARATVRITRVMACSFSQRARHSFEVVP
jgi:hypothetical protein